MTCFPISGIDSDDCQWDKSLPPWNWAWSSSARRNPSTLTMDIIGALSAQQSHQNFKRKWELQLTLIKYAWNGRRSRGIIIWLRMTSSKRRDQFFSPKYLEYRFSADLLPTHLTSAIMAIILQIKKCTFDVQPRIEPAHNRRQWTT